MNKKGNLITPALFLITLLFVCVGCKSELDGKTNEDGSLAGMTLEQAKAYIEQVPKNTEAPPIKIKLTGEMTQSDTSNFALAIRNAMSYNAMRYVELDMSDVTLTDAESGKTVEFQQCSYLSSITLPKNLVELHVESFNYCTYLKSVVIPSSVAIIYNPFKNCSKLESVTFADTESSWYSAKYESAVTRQGAGYPVPVTTYTVSDVTEIGAMSKTKTHENAKKLTEARIWYTDDKEHLTEIKEKDSE